VFTTENIHTVDSLADYGYRDKENRLLHHTRVFFPEYKASFNGDIADTLMEEFGIEDLFDVDKCDMSNITDETLVCEGVVHKTYLEVNKRGIEGAAVTYLPNAGDAGPGEFEEVYHDFIVDRAFGFILTDAYGTVLFSGVINNI
jgi:serpin B